jgi:hypothetical protein
LSLGTRAWTHKTAGSYLLLLTRCVLVTAFRNKPDLARASRPVNARSGSGSTKVSTLRAQYPDNPALHTLSEEIRLVVSEPLGDLAGAWNEVPESSYGVIQHGQDELKVFNPRPN